MNKHKIDISIVIATSDEFEDCWYPFFTLFKKYWPNCEYPIILTTAHKKYSHPGLDIKCSMAGNIYSHSPTWSERLLFTLEKNIKTDIVLFLLDDFFISNNVDVKTISDCYNIMLDNDYSNITLTNHDTKRIFQPTDNPSISKIHQKSPYRITTSPALWKTAALKRYLIPDENIWMFEKFGTHRSYKINDSFYKVNQSAINVGFNEVIPYFQGKDDTGIVKGKWQIGINELFESVGVKLNYELRGFYKNPSYILNKFYTAKKFIKYPRQLIRALFS